MTEAILSLDCTLSSAEVGGTALPVRGMPRPYLSIFQAEVSVEPHQHRPHFHFSLPFPFLTLPTLEVVWLATCFGPSHGRSDRCHFWSEALESQSAFFMTFSPASSSKVQVPPDATPLLPGDACPESALLLAFWAVCYPGITSLP